jgi:ABC-type transport system involved in multi-copper enzyme maturation permease subunit
MSGQAATVPTGHAGQHGGIASGGTTFGAVVRSELLKIRTTRLWWGLLILGVLVVLVFSALIAALSGDAAGGEAANGPAPDDPAALRSIYGVAFTTGYVLPLVLGIIGMSGEYRHQTITPSLLAVPRRGRLVLAKFVAYFLAGLGYGAAFVVAALVGGGLALTLRGYSLGLGGEGVLRTLALAVLGCGVWAVFGLGLGTLIRNQIAAIIVALASQLLVEPLLSFGLNAVSWGGDVAKFLPSSASAAVVAGAQTQGVEIDQLPWWGGALVLVAYGAVFGAVGVALTRRHDVT